MNGWEFPVLGGLIVYGLVVPAASLLALGVLRWRRRSDAGVEGDALGWWLLLAPVAWPVLWALSAVLHLQEGNTAWSGCLYDRAGRCPDVLGFGVVLLLPWFGGVLFTLGRRAFEGGRPVQAPDLKRRLFWLRGRIPALRGVRVRWVARGGHPAAVRGLFPPRIELEADFARSLDDEVLAAVLLHEVEHARCLDVLRMAMAEASLRLNPLRRWLAPELSRWRVAREIACDEAACRRGASPAALAEGIVRALRYGGWRARPEAALTGPGAEVVRLRVALLLAMEEGFAGCGVGRSTSAPMASMGSSLLLALLMPHLAGTGLLDGLHLFVERAFHLLGLH